MEFLLLVDPYAEGVRARIVEVADDETPYPIGIGGSTFRSRGSYESREEAEEARAEYLRQLGEESPM